MKLIDVIYVIILGIIEGITEWLPISSTGHLLIIERLFKENVITQIFTENFNEMFTVVIQLGAICAILSIFFKKLWPFAYFEEYSKQEKWDIWKKIVIASIPAAVVGLLFDDYIDKIFFNPLTIGITLVVYGIIFIIIEYRKKTVIKHNDIKKLSLKLAFTIGLAQVLAMIPGTSRSGITIIAGILLACSRDLSAEFSFLLSIPIMFGASGLKLIKFLLNDSFRFNQIILLLIGLLIAFMVSLLVVKWLLKFIKKHSFKSFGYYRIVLGILIIIGIIIGFF